MTSQKSYERLLYVIFTSCVHWYVSNEKRGWSPLNKISKKTTNHHIFWVCLVYEFCETKWQKQSLYGHFQNFTYQSIYSLSPFFCRFVQLYLMFVHGCYNCMKYRFFHFALCQMATWREWQLYAVSEIFLWNCCISNILSHCYKSFWWVQVS